MIKSNNADGKLETFTIDRVVEIEAPIEFAFEAVMDQLGTDCEMPGSKPFPMKLEAWPGGRWYREIGENAGHLWGHVQVMKPPTLIEICGPLMMSYAAINHLSYRLSAEGLSTRLTFRHQAAGLLETEHFDGLPAGWEYWIERICKLSVEKAEQA